MAKAMSLADARKLAQLHLERDRCMQEFHKYKSFKDKEWQTYADAQTLIGDAIAKMLK